MCVCVCVSFFFFPSLCFFLHQKCTSNLYICRGAVLAATGCVQTAVDHSGAAIVLITTGVLRVSSILGAWRALTLAVSCVWAAPHRQSICFSTLPASSSFFSLLYIECAQMRFGHHLFSKNYLCILYARPEVRYRRRLATIPLV